MNSKRVYKTCCKHGHAYNLENTGYRGDSKARFCRICQNGWGLRYRLRKLQEQQQPQQVVTTKNKLNTVQVRQIREAYQHYQELMLKPPANASDTNVYDATNAVEPPITMERLAVAYGVSRNTISLILRNLTHHDPNYDPKAHVVKLLGQTVVVKSGAKGERSGTAKLTKIKVGKIRQALASGEKNGAELAREYGVSRMTISDIKHGKRWKAVSAGSSSDTANSAPATPNQNAA